MYVCMYVRTYVRTYVCICVYTYLYIYIYEYICISRLLMVIWGQHAQALEQFLSCALAAG